MKDALGWRLICLLGFGTQLETLEILPIFPFPPRLIFRPPLPYPDFRPGPFFFFPDPLFPARFHPLPAGTQFDGLRAGLDPLSLTIGERLRHMPRLQTMATLSQLAGSASPLVVKSNITAFVPTDKAFGLINPDEINAIWQQGEALLNFHIVGTIVDLDALPLGETELRNLGDERIIVFKDTDNQILAISSDGIARVVGRNIQAQNGLIHVLDTVL